MHGSHIQSRRSSNLNMESNWKIVSWVLACYVYKLISRLTVSSRLTECLFLRGEPFQVHYNPRYILFSIPRSSLCISCGLILKSQDCLRVKQRNELNFITSTRMGSSVHHIIEQSIPTQGRTCLYDKLTS